MIEQIVFSFLSAFILESPRVPWVSHFFKTFHKLVKLFRTMKTDGSYHTPCFFIEQLDDFFFHLDQTDSLPLHTSLQVHHDVSFFYHQGWSMQPNPCQRLGISDAFNYFNLLNNDLSNALIILCFNFCY